MTQEKRQPRVVIAGAGMSGMLMGIQLKRAGIEDFTIYEKAQDVGGTWRENTYPGLSCDVPAHYYSYPFELNPEWSRLFAKGPEIQKYMRFVADKYDLRAHIEFGQELAEGEHNGKRWQLQTSGGITDTADVLVTACGVLHHPSYPDIPGLDAFSGPSFHSSRWPENLDLTGKRIGLIGTGSTGVQITTEVGKQGHDLTVFQRTPQWVFPLPNRKYLAAERWLLARVPGWNKLVYRVHEFAFEHFFAQAVVHPGWQRKLIDWLCHWNLNRIKDSELKRKLVPPDQPMCKRMVISWGYYESMQKDNVTLVDTGIEKIVPEGVVTSDGKLHELDVLVLATGFKAHDFMRPMELRSQDGKTLSGLWGERAKAYRSIALPGFPNFFMLQGPKSPVGNFSLISIAQTQTDYIMDCIRLWQQGKFDAMAPLATVTDKLDDELANSMDGTVWVTGCNSWYLDENGVPDTWPSTPARFREYLNSPKLEEFELTGAAPVASGR